MHAGKCTLNFPYPYQPTGECLGSQQRIKLWDSLRTTLCCQNALIALTEALALRALNAQSTPIFLEQGLWADCSGAFVRQPSVSAVACGFSGLFYAPDLCSKLTLQEVMQQYDSYKDARNACSDFSSFDDACNICTTAVLALRDDLLQSSSKTSEKDLCGVAAVVSVASESVNNVSLNDDFFRCLRLLDKPGKIFFFYFCWICD